MAEPVQSTQLHTFLTVLNHVISKKLHFHFLGVFSKLDRVKTMGTRGKINAI